MRAAADACEKLCYDASAVESPLQALPVLWLMCAWRVLLTFDDSGARCG
jgi:hypothetical protein